MSSVPFWYSRIEYGLPAAQGGLTEPVPEPPIPGCQRITTDQSGKPTEVEEYHPLAGVLTWTGATSGANGLHVGYVYTITVYQPITLYQQHIVLNEVAGTFDPDEQLIPSIAPPVGVTVDISTHATNPNQIIVNCTTIQPPIGFASQYVPNQPIFIDDPFDPGPDPEEPIPPIPSCPCAGGGGGPIHTFPIFMPSDCTLCTELSESGNDLGDAAVPVMAPIAIMTGSGIRVGSEVRSRQTGAEYRVVGMGGTNEVVTSLSLQPLTPTVSGAGFRPDDTLFLITDRTQQARVRSPIGDVTS